MRHVELDETGNVTFMCDCGADPNLILASFLPSADFLSVCGREVHSYRGKMTSIENRDEAYRKIVQSKRINTQQEAILKLFLVHGAKTDQQIAEVSGISLNMVNARRNELVEMGILMEFGSELDYSTNRRRTLWKVKEPGDIGLVKPKLSLSHLELTRLEKLIYKANSFQKQKIKEMLE